MTVYAPASWPSWLAWTVAFLVPVVFCTVVCGLVAGLMRFSFYLEDRRAERQISRQLSYKPTRPIEPPDPNELIARAQHQATEHRHSPVHPVALADGTIVAWLCVCCDVQITSRRYMEGDPINMNILQIPGIPFPWEDWMNGYYSDNPTIIQKP